MFDRVDYVLISMCGATYVKWCMTGRVTFQRTSAVAGFMHPGGSLQIAPVPSVFAL